MKDPAVQVRKRGVITLPAELREAYDIQEGDTFRLIDLDGVFVLTRMVSLVPELAQEIERLRMDAGLTTEELLDGLREQRERYHAETYGDEEQT
jgi:AbrB family looped-hinge helix DNA binding protein